MRFLLYIGRFISSMLMNLAVLLFVTSLSLAFVVANKQVIKDSFVESGVYQDVISTALKSIEFDDDGGSPTEKGAGSLPVNDPQIQKVVESSLPPELIQAQTEGLLDSVFSWLDGTDEELNFTIDLTGPKDDFISGVADYAISRTDRLPECTSADLGMDTVDIFKLECRPIGFSSAEIRKQMVNDLTNGDFLNDTVITKEDLTSGNSQSIEDQLSFAPTVYKFTSNGVLISISVLVIVSALFVSVRLPLVRGLRSLGTRLLSSGLKALAFALVFKFLLPGITKSASSSEGDASEILTRLGSIFVEKLDNVAIFGFGSLAAVGGVTLLVSHLLGKSERHKLATHKKSAENTGIPISTAQDTDDSTVSRPKRQD